MTLSEVYRAVCADFCEKNIENGNFEAGLIVRRISGLSQSDFFLRGSDEISEENKDKILSLAKRRTDGEPIQYILGEWDFMNYTFKVGEGVLIPRPETEILTEYVYDKIENISSPVVYDLCSGCGCIGISVKKMKPDSEVYLVEKSAMALEYIRHNCTAVCQENAPEIISGDILYPADFAGLPKADVIISNPPYIKSAEIPTLQSEVLREPHMALDGGEDGLVFYRVLINEWSKFLKDDGFMAFECGEDQSNDIRELFNKAGFDSEAVNDYNNIERIVIGRRKKYVI